MDYLLKAALENPWEPDVEATLLPAGSMIEARAQSHSFFIDAYESSVTAIHVEFGLQQSTRYRPILVDPDTDAYEHPGRGAEFR